MRIIVIITATLCSVFVKAQTSTSDSLISKPDLKKNEIYLNLLPIARTLFTNTSSPVNRFSLSYKRYLNERSALRLSLVADFVQKNAYTAHFGSDRDVYDLGADSSLTKYTIERPGFLSPHVSVGYERVYGKRKLKWFYGADLSLGYSEHLTLKQRIRIVKDSIGWVEEVTFPSTVARSKTTTVSVGIRPFFGLKYPINKRLSVSAQLGVDAAYRSQQVTGSIIGGVRPGHYTSFDFTTESGLLNDISIIYKF
ncbi:MAG: hypothetical protein K0Q95_968 [Bacteroidota bacterium]|jgi:hypothetical protein|nr:hypothetical protein [Bacteroidota bacterium]